MIMTMEKWALLLSALSLFIGILFGGVTIYYGERLRTAKTNIKHLEGEANAIKIKLRNILPFKSEGGIEK